MTQAYPLLWPISRPRTASYKRKAGRFAKNGKDITIAGAMQRLQEELDRLGAKDPVLSANLQRNIDGSPRGNQAQPSDPGVALYFTLKKKPHCLPCDTFTRVEQNIAALAAHIEATRAIERYGVASTEEMFTGFAAISSGPRPWRDVMNYPVGQFVPEAAFNARWRALAQERHPDRGGSDAMMAELNAARDQYREEMAK